MNRRVMIPLCACVTLWAGCAGEGPARMSRPVSESSEPESLRRIHTRHSAIREYAGEFLRYEEDPNNPDSDMPVRRWELRWRTPGAFVFRGPWLSQDGPERELKYDGREAVYVDHARRIFWRGEYTASQLLARPTTLQMWAHPFDLHPMLLLLAKRYATNELWLGVRPTGPLQAADDGHGGFQCTCELASTPRALPLCVYFDASYLLREIRMSRSDLSRNGMPASLPVFFGAPSGQVVFRLHSVVDGKSITGHQTTDPWEVTVPPDYEQTRAPRLSSPPEEQGQ